MATAIDFKSLLSKQRRVNRQQEKPVASSQRVAERWAGVRSVGEALPSFRLPGHPTAYYIPEFISATDEAEMIRQIYDPIASGVKWTALTQRRLCMLGGVPSQGNTKQPLPGWVEDFVDRLQTAGVPSPDNLRYNHVLLNEYSDGMGIAPHFDSDLYRPLVAVLNLQSPALFHFYAISSNHPSEQLEIHSSVYLEPRSLLIFADDLFSTLKHGIPSAKADIIPETVLNGHLLRQYKPGATVTRGGEALSGPQQGPAVFPPFKPRLSLTIRTLSKALGNDTVDEPIESAAARDEAIRNAANFYHSVSEPT